METRRQKLKREKEEICKEIKKLEAWTYEYRDFPKNKLKLEELKRKLADNQVELYYIEKDYLEDKSLNK